MAVVVDPNVWSFLELDTHEISVVDAGAATDIVVGNSDNWRCTDDAGGDGDVTDSDDGANASA